jgi:hypothetical protein
LEDLDSAADEPEYGHDDCECLFLAPGENVLDVFNLFGVGLGSYELEGRGNGASKGRNLFAISPNVGLRVGRFHAHRRLLDAPLRGVFLG